MVGANAVDPHIDFGRLDQSTGNHVSARFGDAFGFPGKAGSPLGLGLGVIGNWGLVCHAANIGQGWGVL